MRNLAFSLTSNNKVPTVTTVWSSMTKNPEETKMFKSVRSLDTHGQGQAYTVTEPYFYLVGFPNLGCPWKTVGWRLFLHLVVSG